uniref:MFS domain-containing protein n=1 Tax=Steinernema glaseri TaxID=37863 RepID=A0A1I7YEF1_9BILA
MSVGPALQAIFAPIGKDGFTYGLLILNMYTIPAYLMIALSILSIILLFTIFHESYAGLLCKESKSPDSAYVLPKFDKYAAGVCLFLWFLNNSLSTNMELIATPLTIALYEWNDQDAVFNNGLLQTVSCLLSVGIYFILGCTRVGKFDRRKMILFALTVFTIYHVVNMPWPFYDGPLNYIPKQGNSTFEDTSIIGGCYERYSWCANTTRVPLMLYVVTATLCFGIAFPFMSSQTGTLYSEILGPRHQGFMQGVLAFFGSISRCVSPLISAIVFERYGYFWPTAGQLILLIIGMSLLGLFRKRLVPLQLVLRSDLTPK